MAIYDPVAAGALVWPEWYTFAPVNMTVSTASDDTYGETRFTPRDKSRVRIASAVDPHVAECCLAAFAKGAVHAR